MILNIKICFRKPWEKVIPIIRTIIFFGRHQLALRKDNGPILNSNAYNNDRNFRSLLKFRDLLRDLTLKTHLENAAANVV